MLLRKHYFILKKMLLPTLHVKLGLVNNFVKAVDKSGESFCFLNRKPSKLSEA